MSLTTIFSSYVLFLWLLFFWQLCFEVKAIVIDLDFIQMEDQVNQTVSLDLTDFWC